MAAPVPTTIPERIAAGDTLLFEVLLSDYDSAAWTLTYNFQKIEPNFEEVDFSAVANGQAFRVTVAATTTVLWTSGTYAGQAFVTSGSERHQVWEGQLEILPNQALSQQEDIRSHNRKVLDALKICQLKLATKQTARALIEGVELYFKDPVALEKLIQTYEMKVGAEDRKASVHQRPVILARFTVPT